MLRAKRRRLRLGWLVWRLIWAFSWSALNLEMYTLKVLLKVLLLAYLLLHYMLVLSSCDHELSWIREAGIRASGLCHHLQRSRLLVKCACLFVVTSIDLSSIDYSCTIDNAMFAVVSMRCRRLVLLTWYDKLGWWRVKWILSYHLLNVLGVKCSLGTLNNIRLMLFWVVTTCNSFNSRLKLEKLVIWVLAIMRRHRCDFSAYNARRRLR